MSEELITADSLSSKPQDTPIDDVVIDLDVVLGETEMALHELLRLGRGAVIALDATEEDDVRILAGNTEIASCLLYTSPSPRDLSTSRMPSSA